MQLSCKPIVFLDAQAKPTLPSTQTPILYLDVRMAPNTTVEQDVPEDYNGFIYVLEGKGTFGARDANAEAHTTLVFSDGDGIGVRAGEDALRFVLIAGKSIGVGPGRRVVGLYVSHAHVPILSVVGTHGTTGPVCDEHTGRTCASYA